MKSAAHGQLLGYTLQYPRALYHLLISSPGDAVCIEDLGDVATIKSNSHIITEEDKSSIVGNPVTDRSTNLWKTFSNWIDLIDNKKINLEKTRFILYCNMSGKDSIVNDFHCAQNQIEAQKAIDNAKETLRDITDAHPIWKYYNFVINQNESVLLTIITRFELQIGNGNCHEEIRREILRKLVPESQVEYLIQLLLGWLQDKITDKIVKKEPAIVSWEDFSHQSLVLFDRARCRELVDYALTFSYDDGYVENEVKTRPTYLQQLEAIESSDEEIIEAVYDYLRADINREKWIEAEIIDEEVAYDFEFRLKEFWKNQAKRIEITEKLLTEQEKGQLLFADCKSRKETIRDITPPHSTIAGTYHALSNATILGWHPNWKNLFSKEKEK